MSWEDAPITQEAPKREAWEDAPIVKAAVPQTQPRFAEGLGEAIQAGYQGSVPGLISRGKLPDIVLNPTHSKWYERLASGVSQMVSEIPEMAVGTIGGGVAGVPAGPAGVLIGAGFGGGALPAAIRESYVQAYTKGEIVNSGDFLARTGIVLERAAKEGAVGAVLMGVGKAVGIGANAVGMSTGGKVIATTAAETVAATMTAAGLEGHLPEPQEFIDTALFITTMKGAGAVGAKALTTNPTTGQSPLTATADAIATKLSNIYRRTGKTPMEVMADSRIEPTIISDLQKPAEQHVTYHASPLPTFDGTREGSIRAAQDLWNKLDDASKDENLSTKEYDATQVAMAQLDKLERSLAKGKRAMGDNAGIAADEFYTSTQPEFWRSVQADELGVDYKHGGIYAIQTKTAVAERNVPAGMGVEAPEGVVKAGDVVRIAGPFKTQDEARRAIEKAEAAPEIPRAYNDLAARMAAQEGVPSEKLKAFAESPFAESAKTKVPVGASLKFAETAEDLKAYRERLIEISQPEIEAQRRGTVPWAQTIAEGEAIFQSIAGADSLARVKREIGSADSAAEIHARNMMFEVAAHEAREAQKAYWDAEPANKPALQVKMLQAAQMAQVLVAEYKGAAAEMGRGLNFLKYLKQSADSADALARTLELYQGKDPDAFARAIGEAQTLGEMAALVKNLGKPDFFDKFMDYYRSAIMSGPMTIMRNTFGGALMVGKGVLTDVYAAVEYKLGASAEPAHFSDAISRVTGVMFAAKMLVYDGAWQTIAKAGNPWQGFKDAGKLAWDSSRSETNSRPLALDPNGGVIERAAYVQAAWVTGANSLIDASMRNFAYYGEMFSRASRAAVEAGHFPGSKGFMDFIQKRVKNPTDADVKAANTEAAKSTFTTESGTLLTNINKTLNMWRGAKLMLPLVTTAGKMFEAGFRNSPFAPLVESWRADLAAGGERAQKARAEESVGRVMWASVYMMAQDEDTLTGYGPVEPGKRAVWLATHQPYSYKGPDGNWYNYGQALQPFGPLLGMVVDTVKLQEYMDEDEQKNVVKYAYLTFKNAITNNTVLQGFANLLSIPTDENGGPRAINSFVASLMPLSGLAGNTAAALDPYQREVKTMLDAIKNRVPVLRETLNPKRDVYGEEVAESDKLAFGVIPSKSIKGNDDFVATEAARLGISVSKTPDHIDLQAGKDKKLGKVELTAEERDKFAKTAGEFSKSTLDSIINSDFWGGAPDQVKKNIMNSVFANSREYARKTVLSPERLMTELIRINTGVRKNYTPPKPVDSKPN